MGKIIRAVAGDDFIKIAVIEARDIVERARQIHSLAPTACAALGRTLCATAIMGNMMKEENAAVTVRINGGGPIGSVLAVADCQGNVRGYVSEPATELPLRSDGKLNVGGAVGADGMLTVIKDIGLRDPYVGSVNLISGEIAEDFSAYFVESEQIPAAVGLGVLVDTDLSVKAAGGFIVQLMPGAPDGLIEKLEDNIFFMDQLTTILAEDGVEEIIAQVLKDLEPCMACLYFNTVPGSRVFLDNIFLTTGTYSQNRVLVRKNLLPVYSRNIPLELHGQTVIGRGVNLERADVALLNDGSAVLLDGFRTEGPGTAVKTVNGGKTEIHLFNAGIGSKWAENPLFEVENAALSLTGALACGYNKDSEYNILVKDTQCDRENVLAWDGADTTRDVFSAIIHSYTGGEL